MGTLGTAIGAQSTVTGVLQRQRIMWAWVCWEQLGSSQSPQMNVRFKLSRYRPRSHFRPRWLWLIGVSVKLRYLLIQRVSEAGRTTMSLFRVFRTWGDHLLKLHFWGPRIHISLCFWSGKLTFDREVVRRREKKSFLSYSKSLGFASTPETIFASKFATFPYIQIRNASMFFD